MEYGFLDSTGDDVNQLKNNWENYAEAVVRALTNYIGKEYTPVLGSNYYKVQKGDSLWSIAKRFNISVNELKSMNDLSSNLISIGQIIKIAPSSESTVDSNSYIVQKGDTLYGISKKFNVGVDEIKKANNLANESLSIGQVLLIPKKEIAIEDIENVSTYKVQSGDTLYGIAKKYNVYVNELKTINNLLSNTLSIGQILKIPSKEEFNTYTVIKGDNLYNIAKNYNTSVSNLIDINNLSTSNLSIGQKLLVPKK